MQIKYYFFKTLNNILSPIPPKLILSLQKWIDKGLKTYNFNPFKYEMQIRAKYRLNNLKALAKDIPNLITPEKYPHNDFYFNALNLKKYAGIDENDYIRAAIEHGPYMGEGFWDQDVNSPFSSIIVCANYRREILKKVCNKNIIVIGPYIAYAKNVLSNKAMQKEKKRLGNNLLVFPSHSTHWVYTEYNINDFISKIQEISKNFDTVRICMYWKDILRGTYKPYQKTGFEIVCAGHIYEPNFLPRLRSIIELSDFTMSNNIGTHIGYCVYLNKPHYLIESQFKFINHLENSSEILSNDSNFKSKIDIKKAFSKFSDIITDEQFKVVDKYWGISEVKTKEEMKSILLELEKNYIKNEVLTNEVLK